MINWLFISTGVFLGWSLGANHAVNVFGTAVASRMVRFRTAAVVAGIRRGLLDPQVRVSTRGGDLAIAWAGTAGMTAPLPPVMMTGDAVRVFEGEFDLPAPGPQENPVC